jgi:inositol transport system substrate-binding protein
MLIFNISDKENNNNRRTLSMKKTLAIALVLIMVFAFVGCQQAAPAETAAPETSQEQTEPESKSPEDESPSAEKYTVAYIARTLSDPFASWLASEMQNAAKQYADTFTLDVLDSQGDSEKQNTLIDTAITKGYDAIIIQPNDGEAQRPYAEKVVEAGIICITTNAKIPDIAGASSVDADPYNQGAVLANAAVVAVPENGKVVILNCLPGNLHTTARYQAFQEIFIAQRPDVTIVADHIFNEVDYAGTLAFVQDIVQSKGKVDCFLTTADYIALAALEAVKDNPEFDNVLAYGVDGLSGALLSIKSGKNQGCCLQNAVELGEKNMKAVYQLLTGAETQVEDSIGEVYIDASNVDEWIAKYIEYGLLTQEEADSYNN